MSADVVRRLLIARGLRGFIDGLVSVTLAAHLLRVGFAPGQVGALITGTLIGSAALTIAVGLFAHHMQARLLLICASWLMVATGLGFAGLSGFWPLFLVAVVGTLNPSSGDVSVFLPLEQATLAATGEGGPRRTSLFARYNVVGAFAGSFGALCAGLPELIGRMQLMTTAAAERSVFLAYAMIGLIAALIYRGLPSAPATRRPGAPLATSRRIVARLAALFSLDAFGGGFVVQSILVLWLYRRFQLSVEMAGGIFFVAGLAGALSQFLSGRLAARIGLVRTMVFTHLPANLFLVAAGLMPRLEWAVAFLLLRACISSMDVPARQAYVMAVVPPEERPAAASLTNVPRSLAAAVPPFLAGLMLERTSFGWPLVIAGLLKAGYDLVLFWNLRKTSVE